MALIIEDGSIVTGANSYCTVAELDSFAALRGLTLPALTADKEILLIKAMDYLNAKRYKGNIVEQIQPLPWPRLHVIYEGFEIAYNTIPDKIKNAQLQAAIEVQTKDLQENGGRETIREKVDVIEVEYSKGIQFTYFSKVEDFLKGLTVSSTLMGLAR